ncbi:ANL_collapsed_G0050220.mRNA.1.CDS.1 [Saccharomyces cerevisiae]|nr:BDN_1c_G0049220.mRNA.1.CDS.1 [Saccharomyces cerevisiae]CAI4920408.1 ANL_HP_G0194420.mRNA.1.CDS.1 [Saccharomyces cerevisiae]CAI4930923.1 ANM_HP_G0112570.mRNA.1.CDS.1 [Saccharomyces cerevisiae]CAI4936708.1 ANM_HP_G0116740.mRNA.1.CDS.1 [Saccharomyces cerevisiae]CAI4971697.1 ANL_HP_G0033700.mRNA.1.CDS.1 [Saccharomyces cerevisiae]
MSNATNNTLGSLLPQLEAAANSNSLYGGMVPNLRFNITMIVIWGILLTIHVVQLLMRQYWFSIAFVCTGILEVLGFIGRTWSHSNVADMDAFLLNMICLTIAPVFTMGGIYYQLAKLIEVYGHRFSLLPSPMAYSFIFICSDIVSLVVQAVGGGLCGVAVTDGTSTTTGNHVFIAGLAIQVASMAIFLMLWFHFLFRIYISVRWEHINSRPISLSLLKISQTEVDYLYREKFHFLRLEPKRWVFHYFNLAMTVAVLTIFTRCCYRLAELVVGWDGYLITHEWYFIILDALMMAIATVTLTIFHPGFAFKGRSTSIPITPGHVDPETLPHTDDVEDILDTSDSKQFDIEKEEFQASMKYPISTFKQFMSKIANLFSSKKKAKL